MERKITALKAQKRNPNRISVYLDGEYAFGLARIVAAWLSIGQILTEEKIAALQHQDALEVATVKALRFLSHRARSEKEVRQKLRDHGFDDEQTDAVVQRLKDNRLIGDEQFAADWIDNRSTFRPRSRRVMALELRQKGVAEDVIDDALNDAAEDSILAYEAARRYARRLAGLDWQMFRDKLGGFLARRGFPYGTIAPVVRQVWDEMKQQNAGDLPNAEMRD